MMQPLLTSRLQTTQLELAIRFVELGTKDQRKSLYSTELKCLMSVRDRFHAAMSCWRKMVTIMV